MKKLILYGTDSNCPICSQLVDFLQEKLSFSLFRKGSMEDFGSSPQLEIIETEELELLNTRETMIFLKKKANLKKVKMLSHSATVIINSANQRQLEYASRFRAQMVTVGLSNKDTVTFSSKNEEEWVISLQRSVRTLVGTVAEPMEIPCRILGRCDDGYVLAYVAILILLNQINLGEKLEISGR